MARTLAVTAVTACLLAGVVIGAGLWHLDRWGETPLQAEATVTLSPGESVTRFGNRLARRELIGSARLFRWYLRWEGLDTQLQAGTYAIEPETTPAMLFADMAAGREVQYQVQLLEGTTVRDVLATLKEAPWLEHTIEAEDAEALHAELALETRFAEGMFFPDTYAYTRGATDRSVLERAHRMMLEEAASAWQARSPEVLLQDVEELIILASIVEKESGVPSDRNQISQVFHLRLAQRMLLQTDPTVIYGLGEAFDGNLTRAHLNADGPFNTYKRRGLPPTAIALPSQAALVAAAQPAAGEYLYFVARGDGSSQFSRTLAEHNAAVRRYQLGITDG